MRIGGEFEYLSSADHAFLYLTSTQEIPIIN